MKQVLLLTYQENTEKKADGLSVSPITHDPLPMTRLHTYHISASKVSEGTVITR
jgi:hypothetical protein